MTTQTATHPTPTRHTRPIDEAEYNDLCECRCTRLPGTHTAGQCATTP
ncbi:hypothetical protein [Actinokineospora enzanensis]|nr:hypothetical protein [Actinokineospora enzanensis]